MLSDFSGQRVVLLQGPMGPFFSRLGRELEANGAHVIKVHFNAADALFYRGTDVRPFRGSLEEWPAFCRNLLIETGARAVFLFGDSRPYHSIACSIARELGVERYVFEEGYIRPDCITIERGGVNRNSSMAKELDAYGKEPRRTPTLDSVGNTYWYMALFATCYSIVLTALAWMYPRYQHHKNLNAFIQLYWALTGFLRYCRNAVRERWIADVVEAAWRKRYFLVALQVHDDYQVKNSRFGGVPEFITEVVTSFAQHANPKHRLVLKHHPLDRGTSDYTSLIADLAARYQLGDRLVYVHDVHLPTLLRHARATVVMNSTVGFSSLIHGTPVKVLDDAVYAIKGLTIDAPLEQVWTQKHEVNRHAFERVRSWMLTENQANGSFYRRLTQTAPTGIVWPKARAALPSMATSDVVRYDERSTHPGSRPRESYTPVSS